MNACPRTLLAIGLIATIAAGTAISAPTRLSRGNALLPPSAAQLHLSGPQAQQWDALREESRALRSVARADLHAGIAELRTLLDTAAPDLRAFDAEAQRRIEAHLAEMRALHARQLALYESLPPDAQARVRAAMAERLDRMALLRERLAAFTSVGS
jgi:Spy/CpxP family protein refolding chaperone